MRNAKRLALFALTAATAAVVGCSAINPDIDRVSIDPYWTKADFIDGDSWYYNATVVEGAPNSYLFPGDGGFIVMERLKWEITEELLIGWRDYSAAPGTEIDALEGGDDVFKGQPIAIYKINGHFDIRNTYSAMTGERRNEIVENEERDWNKREYFRVNWSLNQVPSYNSRFSTAEATPFGPADSYNYAIEHNEIGDPRRWRFERNEADELDYFEITSRAAVAPSWYSIIGWQGPQRFLDLAPTVVDIRHSFMKVEESDYIPLAFPDSVSRVDEMGNEVRDEDGFTERAPIMDRFGFFTTWNRQVWDPDRGFTKPGEQNYAIRYNVWEQNRDSMGNPIPFANREPKPMIWYTNQTHPQQLLNGSKRVANEWNKVFKEMVFEARNLSASELGLDQVYADLDAVPDMFVWRENDCNPAAVDAFLASAPARIRDLVGGDAKDYNFDGTIETVLANYAWANSYDNNDSIGQRQTLETQALSDLERICSALEWHTSEFPEADYVGVAFKYQRDGDIRYNMINGIVEKAPAPWLGVATILADPLTGEEVKGTANVGLAAIDLSAYRANEAIRALNGEIELDDILYGYDIQNYIQEKLIKSRLLMSYRPSDETRASMDARFSALGQGEEALREMSPAFAKSRLSRLQGTHIEDIVVTDEDVLAYGRLDAEVLAEFDGDVDAATLDRSSILRNWDVTGPQSEKARFDKMGELGIDPVEFIDQFALGAAIAYRKIESDRERYEKIREDLYVSVQLHEVGHVIGLRHNFEASSDSLNYGRKFWEIQELSVDLDDALGEVDPSSDRYETITDCISYQQTLRVQEGDPTFVLTTQECLAQNQQMYSTIMEYNGHWTADFGGCDEGCGLGPYDYQAIKFGYAQMLETFNRPTADRTEAEVVEMMHYNDWRDIPGDVVQDIDAIMDRSQFFYDWNTYSTSQELPANTVPYRFCTDGYSTQTCGRWDWGPDSRYNTSFDEYTYYQRYFFTHYARNRLWDIGEGNWQRAINLDYRTMMNYTRKMQWYFFYKTLDPKFAGTYLEEDLLATTINGLNHIMHVLGHPPSGTYHEVPIAWNERYTEDAPSDYATDADRLAPSNIMRAFTNLSSCTAQYVANVQQVTPESVRPVSGANGFNMGHVKLGDGRPFAIGSTRIDSETWTINYVGTYFAKQLALQVLAYPYTWFPKVDMAGTDPRNFNISWYRLFPKEVGGLMNNFITENYADIGPLIDENGNLVYRDLIDPATGEAPDYTGMSRVPPIIPFNLQYEAALYSMAWMSDAYDSQYDMTNSFILAVEGAADDFGLFDQLASDPETADMVVEFEHPVTGRRIRAVDVGPNPIGANLVRRANLLKERYETLDGCVEGTLNPAVTPYCKCAQVYNTGIDMEGNPQLQCTTSALLATPGEDGCAEFELENRRDRSRELMDDMQDYIDNVRFIKNVLEF